MHCGDELIFSFLALDPLAFSVLQLTLKEYATILWSSYQSISRHLKTRQGPAEMHYGCSTFLRPPALHGETELLQLKPRKVQQLQPSVLEMTSNARYTDPKTYRNEASREAIIENIDVYLATTFCVIQDRCKRIDTCLTKMSNVYAGSPFAVLFKSA